MKKSRVLTLALMASVALVACAPAQNNQRAVYKSRDDCIKDWVNENPDKNKDFQKAVDTAEDVCEAVPTNQGYPGGYYYGPMFHYVGGMPYYYSSHTTSYVQVPQTAQVYRDPDMLRSRAVDTANFDKSGRFVSKGGVKPSASSAVKSGRSSYMPNSYKPMATPRASTSARGGFGTSARGGVSFGG